MIGMGLGVGLGTPLLLALATIAVLLKLSRRVIETQGDGSLASDEISMVTNMPSMQDIYHQSSTQSEVFEAFKRERLYIAPSIDLYMEQPLRSGSI